MEAESLTLAQTLTGAEEGDPLLSALCTAAETVLTGRMRSGVTAGDCGGAFSCAAALLAAADWQESRQSLEEAVSFRAGEVSVTAQAAESRRAAAAALREMAWRLMAPYTAEAGFCFRGIEA